jgi:hypothetical protein
MPQRSGEILPEVAGFWQGFFSAPERPAPPNLEKTNAKRASFSPF